jgi:hypothetical protein
MLTLANNRRNRERGMVGIDCREAGWLKIRMGYRQKQHLNESIAENGLDVNLV